MLIHRAAGRLHDEDVCATYVFLNLNVGFAVSKSPDQRKPAAHPEESANFIGQWLIRRTAENLELVIHTCALRLALVLLVSVHLFFRGGDCGCHKISS